nr:TonB-dependent receptor [uncultured Duganella sp.]
MPLSLRILSRVLIALCRQGVASVPVTMLPWLLAGVAPLPCAAQDPEGASATQSVTVTAQRAAVVNKLDRTVYDVANSPRAANGSAQDVLQATPEVSVSADGRIAVKGGANVTVLIDGKPTAMLSGDERALALQTMSGTDIACVEVITNPSAAYNANGGAVVNLVMKRNRKPGAHAQLRGSATDQGLWNLGASGDATARDISVRGNLAYRHDGNLKQRRSAIDWINPALGQTGQSVQASEVFVRRVVESAGADVDYRLGDSDSVSLSARHNQRRSRPLLDVLNENLAGADRTIFHRLSDGPNEQSDHSASLGYSRQDRGAALKAMVQRSGTNGLIDKSYSDAYLEPARATVYSRGATRSTRRLDQATVDWTRAADLGQWGIGVDVQDEVNDLSNYQALIDRATGTQTPDPDTTNAYQVATTLGAAYVTDRIRRGKWEALLGARFERMALRVHPARGQTRSTRWRAFNPSLHLQYAASDKTDLTLNYRRSLQRPDPRDLNPFTTYVDAQNLSGGNPGLGPQRLTSWEAGANVDAGRVTGRAGAFHRASRDTVVDAREFTAGYVLVTSRRNGGRARSAGVTGALDWAPDTALKLGVDGGLYQVALSTPDLGAAVRQQGVSGYLNARAAYKAGADDISLDAHLLSSGITPLGGYGATSTVNLGWKRELGKTLTLTVNANDIFDGSRRSYRTDAATFRQSGFDHFVARRLYVGFVKKLE